MYLVICNLILLVICNKDQTIENRESPSFLVSYIYELISAFVFQEQRTSQLPLELDQIADDSASTRTDADVKSK